MPRRLRGDTDGMDFNLAGGGLLLVVVAILFYVGLAALGLYIHYLVMKAAVRNGVLEAASRGSRGQPIPYLPGQY